MDKKRKQHFVPRLYLNAWAVNNQVWCKQGGRVFLTALDNVANIRDFYRLKPISKKEYKLIEYFVGLMDESCRENFRELMDYMASIYNICENQRIRENRDAFTEEEDIHINNAFENFYAHIEGMAVPCLKELRDGKADFYMVPEQSLKFLLFLSLQYNRTEKAKTNTLSAIQAHFHNVYNIISIAIAFRLSYTMFTDRWMITILKNNTDKEFITGDQPIINLIQPKSMEEEYRGTIFYYPISPKYAILLSESYGIQILSVSVTSESVTYYNNHIKSNSYRSVYSVNKDTLA